MRGGVRLKAQELGHERVNSSSSNIRSRSRSSEGAASKMRLAENFFFKRNTLLPDVSAAIFDGY